MGISVTVTGLYMSRSAGESMETLDQVYAIAGVGLQGDRYATGQGYYSDKRPAVRHATVIAEEAIAEANAEAGFDLTANQMRRNISVNGLNPGELNALVGEDFMIGNIACRGAELCTPCTYLSGMLEEDGRAFLKAFKNRGGIRIELRESGLIQLGSSLQT